MLEVHALQLQRGNGFALHLPHWTLRPGTVHTLLGSNGAGKSTLLKLLSAEESSRGQIFLHGRDLASWPPEARARHLGVLPQASALNFAFNAEEVVALGLTPLALGWREARRSVRAMMRATDCAHLARQAYPGLSGGERQRVQMARVLVQLSQAEQPPLLLLDEPTSAQDLGQQHRLLSLACSLASEHDYGVVAILHDLNLALRYAQQCLLLDAGQAVACGAPTKVLTAANIRRYWGYSATLLRSDEGRTVIA